MDMNWAAVSAIVSTVTFLAVVCGFAYMWGQLTEKVDGLKGIIDENTVNVKTHGAQLSDHAVAIGKLQEWKEGYNAAASIGRHASQIT